MDSKNPLLSPTRLFDFGRNETGQNIMTIEGTIAKIAIALCLMIGGAFIGWMISFNIISVILGPICAFIALIFIFATIWNKAKAPTFVPLYAVTQGCSLGIMSCHFASQYSGILFAAFGLTVGTLAGMLLLYRLEIIKTSENFYAGVMAATFGIFTMVLLQYFLYALGVTNVAFSGALGIIVQLVIVGVAALNLVIDFDLIVQTSKQNAPKYMEWYGAMTLLVTLVWLYIEVLKLFAKFARRK